MSDDVRDAGYDELIEALAEGEGYYLGCSNGHGSLPPRTVCPTCGDGDLERERMAPAGEVETWTLTTVATPQFEDDAPYVTAIASFGPVRLTGLLRGVDADDVEQGLTVTPTVEDRATTGDPVVVFRPR